MAVVECNIGVTLGAKIDFNEVELRALNAMAGYGVEPFLKVFYEKLGAAYMKPYEAGIRSLFTKIADEVNPAIHRGDEANRILQKVLAEEATKRRMLAAQKLAA